MASHPDHADIAAVEIIRDAETVAALLKPPRLTLLTALREPHSATGLARRLKMARQGLNYHLHELERLGLIVLVEERPRRNLIERILQASARRYLISPEVLGELGSFSTQDLVDPYAWTSLAAASTHALSHLALLREATDGEPPTLTLPSRLRFASTEALDAFTVELTEQLGRLVRKYHDEDAEASYWFVLSAYPEGSESKSPFDVPGIKTRATTAEILDAVQESRAGRR